MLLASRRLSPLSAGGKPLLAAALVLSLLSLLLPLAYQRLLATDASVVRAPPQPSASPLVAPAGSTAAGPSHDSALSAAALLHEPEATALADKVTVLLTGYEGGIRAGWLHDTVQRYLSADFDALVDRVLLVWNNPAVPCPVAAQHPRLAVLSQRSNSLNHRWTRSLPFIRTAAVFNLDDDVFVSRAGLQCALRWWRNDTQRLVAPYVRLVRADLSYVMDDLRLGGRYSIALPRALLLSRAHMALYANSPPPLLRYVDEQEARCDDILLNALVGNATRRPPLRLLLPAGSVTDHFANCDFGNTPGVGGLTMQRNRSALRSECTIAIARMLGEGGGGLCHATDAVATCTADGQRAAVQHALGHGEFAAMLNNTPCRVNELGRTGDTG